MGKIVVDKVMVGLLPVGKIYLGTTQVYKSDVVLYPKNTAPEGVYILTTDDYCISANDWQWVNKTAVGIAIIYNFTNGDTGQVISTHKFVYALEESSSKLTFGEEVDIEAIPNEDYVPALKYFDGKVYTDAIIAQLGIDNAPAAKYCKRYSYQNRPAGTWYLPTYGQMLVTWQNYNQIKDCLTVLKAMSLKTDEAYYSSSERTGSIAYAVKYNYALNSCYKRSYLHVRAASDL